MLIPLGQTRQGKTHWTGLRGQLLQRLSSVSPPWGPQYCVPLPSPPPPAALAKLISLLGKEVNPDPRSFKNSSFPGK